jgi:hypothetical protein
MPGRYPTGNSRATSFAVTMPAIPTRPRCRDNAAEHVTRSIAADIASRPLFVRSAASGKCGLG